MWVNENGILMDDRIPQQPDFFRKSQKYFRLMTCKCGQQFELRTPYELCNPELRDLCSDCIEKLPLPNNNNNKLGTDPDPDPDQIKKSEGTVTHG